LERVRNSTVDAGVVSAQMSIKGSMKTTGRREGSVVAIDQAGKKVSSTGAGIEQSAVVLAESSR
jgi:hypothetical protein